MRVIIINCNSATRYLQKADGRAHRRRRADDRPVGDAGVYTRPAAGEVVTRDTSSSYPPEYVVAPVVAAAVRPNAYLLPRSSNYYR